MKYMNVKKQYVSLNLQFFAEGGEGDDGGDAGEGDDQDEDEGSDEDGEDEKKYSQRDVDETVKKRLARERRKWQREQQREKPGKEKEDNGESEDSKARKAAEERASKAEAKNACYEAGVSKEAVDDVVALARSYMASDEDLDLEEAIEKVVKKYPQFKNGTADHDDEEEEKGKSWGERQGKGSKKMSGVEKRFYELNPDLKK